MRKTIALLLALAIMFSATACAASRQKIEKNADGTVTVVEEEPKQPPKKTYEQMTLDEKLEYKAQQIPEAGVITDNGMLAPACDSQSGKWGYIRSDGEWAIEPQFNKGGVFADGLAPVIDAYSEYIFIDTSGNRYIGNIGGKSILGSSHSSEGVLPVSLDVGQDQYKVYYLGDDKTIDAKDLPKTDGVKYMNTKYFMVATEFFGGKAVVMRRTNESLLASGEKTRETIEKKSLYQSAYVINKEGEIITTLPAGYDVTDYGLDENGIIIVCDQTTEDSFYGLYDVYGREVAGCVYRRIEHCDGDYYLVCDQTGFWGYIDKNGKALTECAFVDAKAFSDGLAVVSDGEKWGVIDTSGNIVIDYEWDGFAALKSANLDTNVGRAAYAFGVAVAQRGDYWALIDSKGDIKYAVKAEECPFGNLSGGLVSFNENGFWGLMNTLGEKVIDPVFSDIGAFGN